ncbi:MAG: Bug family tripartite tricarboxylate transporter substrate binding protein [Xanthobacteraceae bacterium]
MERRSLLARLAAVALAPVLPQVALAQTYPARPLKLVVPFPAGGPADFFARTLAQGLGSELGQQVVLENRGGAGGSTGIDSVAKSAPDGYTLGLSSGSILAALPFQTSKFPFDFQKDLTLLTLVTRVREVLVVHPSVPANALQELVAYAKANPRKVSYGSAGIGTFTHLAVELLRISANVELVHVPYRGAAPAVQDLLGGHIQLATLDVPVLLPHIRSGAVRALAVTSASRSQALPNVPTSAEAGFPTVLSDNWYGLVAPSALPAEVENRLQKAAHNSLRSSDLKKQFENQDAEPSPTTEQEFAEFVRSERVKWEPLVTSIGIKVD